MTGAEGVEVLVTAGVGERVCATRCSTRGGAAHRSRFDHLLFGVRRVGKEAKQAVEPRTQGGVCVGGKEMHEGEGQDGRRAHSE